MADQFCNDGYELCVGMAVADTPASPPTMYLRLYDNNYTPVLAESPSNFTECTDPGYAAIALVPGTWSDISSGGHIKWSYPTQVFNFTGAGSRYGYYVTDAGPTKVYWAGLFAGGPFVYPSGGGSLSGSLELDGP